MNFPSKNVYFIYFNSLIFKSRQKQLKKKKKKKKKNTKVRGLHHP